MELQISYHLEALNFVYLFIYLFIFFFGGGGGSWGQVIHFPVAFRRAILKTF